MTTTKACQGTGVSGWERARVSYWEWAKVGNFVRIRVRVRVNLNLALSLKWGGIRAGGEKQG